jgi:hypothetical protein
MDGFDTSGLVGTNSFGFSVGPQNDGTYVSPSSSLPFNQAVDTGTGSSIGNYSPQIFGLLNNGLSAFTSIYNNNALLDYKRYETTQGGIYMQGQAAASVGQAQVAAINSNKMLMILGLFAVLALAIHKG